MILSDIPELPVYSAPAKARILQTANGLFYEIGIRSVGVDLIIKESAVTKATFYKHYRAKDRLVVDYVTTRHHLLRAELEDIIERSADSSGALREWVNVTVAEILRPGFRGCPFINAAAEFPEADHPVRLIIAAHRDWYVDALANLLRLLGNPVPGDAADELLLARDGALCAGYAGDSVAACAALGRIAARVLAQSDEVLAAR